MATREAPACLRIGSVRLSVAVASKVGTAVVVVLRGQGVGGARTQEMVSRVRVRIRRTLVRARVHERVCTKAKINVCAKACRNLFVCARAHARPSRGMCCNPGCELN
eukprot:1053615-Pleurochrysis_carterae.AAC.2